MKANRTPLLLLLCFFIAVISACHKSAVMPFKGKDLTLSVIEQQKVTSDNTFTLKLFRNLDSANTTGVNLFVSPLSVGFALGMTSNGAKGATLNAIRSTMHFNGYTQDEINTYYNKLLTDLPQLDQNTTVNIANSIWYRNTFSVVPQFLQATGTSYDAKIQSLDFNNPASVTTINDWVSTQTKGKITAIIDQIPSDAVMYLINAIYFRSSWKESFSPVNTSTKPFYLDGLTTVQTSFMQGTIDFNYFYDNSNKVNVYELPYSNDKYSMIILMPSTGSVHALAAGIDSSKWQGWMAGLRSVNSQLTLPKFKFSYSVTLNDALKALGMGLAFSDDADFTGINAAGQLKISEVKHKAYVETDESGTTAAAVTSVGVTTSVAEQPFNTNINHPFIFAIRERSSGLILFAGTVNNPSLAGE